MLIVGLTGSIGMGKSTAAQHLVARRIPVIDADALVHRLYSGSLAGAIETAFPGTTVDGAVDRARLSAALAAQPESFARLEAIVHPAVRVAERAKLQALSRRGEPVAVLEIPLLFETGADGLVDQTIVVTTDAATQRMRVLARPGMTGDKLDSILARQMPDAEKRRRADFVVDTSGPVEDTRAQIDDILARLPGLPAHAFARHWSEGGA
ncbi:MAG: dephospho-CoA kinase [Hyphomicrobium aestuarii]|nr:dephospho-CoA kinase [Hyphomicrobium aestuarii]